MGMQSFRGAGGAGAFSTPVARLDRDSFGEYELAPLARDGFTEREQHVERVPIGIATGLGRMSELDVA